MIDTTETPLLSISNARLLLYWQKCKNVQEETPNTF